MDSRIRSVIRIATKIVSLGPSAMLPLQKISSKSVHMFASNPTDRQTNRQTDRTKNITSFFGGGKNKQITMKYFTGYLLTAVGLPLRRQCRLTGHTRQHGPTRPDTCGPDMLAPVSTTVDVSTQMSQRVRPTFVRSFWPVLVRVGPWNPV